MKKELMKSALVILLFAFVLPFNPLKAQSNDKTWSIGVEGGANFSKLGNDASDSDLKPGLLLGGNLTYSIRNTYGFTGKLLYSQKGVQETTNGVTYKSTLNYIEVPVVARIFFNRNGNFRPNLFAGPSLGFLTGASNKTGSADRVKLDNYKNTFKTFDFGLTGGIGFNYEMMNDIWLLIDARYTHGLTDITKSGSTSINNQAIGITAGFAIGI
ncbi:MAG: porin family protein [Azospira oryzae]|jgi:outer membrane protein W|nr:MAG: porin family protein [Azospira oryzae]